jgi:hypothetical protein
MTGDPAEELLRRLNDDAVLASQVARPQYLQRILGERRRRHVRTVRSVARSRNQRPPASLAALIGFAVIALLIALAARAHAAPAGAASASPPLPTFDDSDDVMARESDSVVFASGADVPIVGDDDLPVGPVAAVVLRAAPRLADVIAAAHRTAGIDRGSSPVAGWRARSRWSAVVPSVSVRAGNTASWRDVDDPTLLTVSRGAAFDVRATWRLEELIYDPNELRFEGFELAMRRERRKVASITTRLYFAWVRATSQAADGADARVVLRAAELAAQLDALTAGWFSDQRTRQNR